MNGVRAERAAVALLALTFIGACNSLRVDPDDPPSASAGTDALIASAGGVDPAFDDTWVAIDFYDLVGIVEQGRPLTCLHAFQIADARLVAFHDCDESLSAGFPDLSVDRLVAPVEVTDNSDAGFDAIFEVIDPDTADSLGAQIEMDALETQTERFEAIGENAAGFIKITTTAGPTTATNTSYVHIVRLSAYEQLAGGG